MPERGQNHSSHAVSRALQRGCRRVEQQACLLVHCRSSRSSRSSSGSKRRRRRVRGVLGVGLRRGQSSVSPLRPQAVTQTQAGKQIVVIVVVCKCSNHTTVIIPIVIVGVILRRCHSSSFTAVLLLCSSSFFRLQSAASPLQVVGAGLESGGYVLYFALDQARSGGSLLFQHVNIWHHIRYGTLNRRFFQLFQCYFRRGQRKPLTHTVFAFKNSQR
mmetsp:Transcript_41909/g.82273  ORF Transcript_41909/g.82273 Transcript_41909/m.82273 type:complete len:216 (+) Transcript_41909:2382-3029(+)